MAWPIVEVSDLTDRAKLDPEDEATAPTRIRDAEAMLRSALRERGITDTPTFDSVDERSDWESRYVAAVVEAVRRYFLNDEGWLEERDSIDDWDRTRRRDAAVSSGRLYISDDEADALVPRKRRRRGAFSIVLGRS
ncbi:hypothetical protein [Microbacterium gilvum]|uniref:Head-to-tail adaptor n=1 Tax=Microbacterium gilvum TaxID=1336204 RepID=A0ABP8ZRD0_9MICO